jgi:D-methionine transport system permease protein
MSVELYALLANAFLETIFMVFASGAVAFTLGTPIGVILMASKPMGIYPHPLLHRSLNFIVDMTRSLPFIILLIAVIPLTRLIVGSSIGTLAAIVPLSLAAIPFVARLVEAALAEVPNGLIEAGFSMGATPKQLVTRILLPEARPGIISGFTLTLINLVGYSAMAGAVGGGGLGDLAIRYGYQRFEISIMIATIVILIVLVQLIQWSGQALANKVRH